MRAIAGSASCRTGRWICAWIPPGRDRRRVVVLRGVDEIARVLKEYGEERFARRIAAAIVEARTERAISRQPGWRRWSVKPIPGGEKHKHPATRAFQAIRIKVNSELTDLQALLAAALDLLRVGGRLVVISFHSLEDRLVKRYMRDMARGSVPDGCAGA